MVRKELSGLPILSEEARDLHGLQGHKIEQFFPPPEGFNRTLSEGNGQKETMEGIVRVGKIPQEDLNTSLRRGEPSGKPGGIRDEAIPPRQKHLDEIFPADLFPQENDF